MPVISVGRDKLFKSLGREYSQEEFEGLCFDYGVELDDVTSEQEMLRKEHGGQENKEASDEVLYKIDIPANRYDMLCLEGIARALNIFNRRIPVPQYKLRDMTGTRPLQLTVKPETALVRPFAVAAVLRGITFDSTSYSSFIDLQDKLHQNLCRQRSLVAIGTHDLATVQAPFTYEALPPEKINFIPLKQKKSFNGRELMQHYLDSDAKLKKFVPIIQDSIVYPVILDANRTVLSLPPIINGAHSAISLNTKDVFIEITATDLTKAQIVLNTVCTMFCEYCSTPFEVEPVEVIDSFGNKKLYPDLSSREMVVPEEVINRGIGVQLGTAQMADLLSRMQLQAEPVQAGQAVRVMVPPTRSDVLHACDVMEDVAIAYGYNNVGLSVPPTVTVGKELPLNQLVELLRVECAMCGFTEILTWALCSRQENFGHLRRQDDGNTAVSIGNPATAEFEVCRTSLLQGALKTLGANKDLALPIKLFELSDVVLLAPDKEVGSTNQRQLVAVHCSKESGFEIIHGLLNRVMEVLGIPLRQDNLAQDDPNNNKLAKQYPNGGYSWRAATDSHDAYFSGRQADIFLEASTSSQKSEVRIGKFGIIHPEVLSKFDIPFPVSALELNIEPFCYDQFYQALPTHLTMTGDKEMQTLQ
ncbi:hypothetical protein ABBQ32_003906 [Trebouxia sp. C0010 RCD-2024]